MSVCPKRRVFSFVVAALALYTGISLWLFSKGDSRQPNPPRKPAVGAKAESGVPQDLATDADNPLLHRSALPLAPGALERVEAFDLRLTAPRRLERCTVQIALTADHHGVFTHTLRDQTLDPAGVSVRVPLRDAVAVWHADGHAATWSDWEPPTLRLIEAKVFAGSPVRGRLTAAWTTVVATNRLEPSLLWARPIEPEVALGDRFELAFDLAGWRGNAFDNRQLDVRLRVTPPGGEARESRAFLYQSFETRETPSGETCGPTGAKHLRARMRPGAAGPHEWALILYREGTSHELAHGAFAVSKGHPPDFIRVSATAPRYFEHADGRFFYPIGWTVLCPVDTPHGERYLPYLPARNSLRGMGDMLDYLADSGANCTRVWMAEWWLGLEWSASKDNYLNLGRYNLKHAWMLDRILDLCERRNVHVILETINHYGTRQADRYGGVWHDNPYNTRNGGFLSAPEEFWQDSRVVPFEQQRLGYIAARYADSPAIHSWQYVSETDLAANCDWISNWRDIQARLATVLRILRTEDTYGHPCGTHVADLARAISFAGKREADLLTSNAYASRAGRDILSEEQVEAMAVFARACQSLRKPVLVTEYGGRWLVEPTEVRRRDLLSGLWAGVASPLSGAPIAWWWNLIYGEDIGSYWQAVSRFMEGEDLRAEDTDALGRWLSRPAQCATPESPTPGVLMAGNARRRYAYVFNPETVTRSRLRASVCRQTTLACGDLRPGRYGIEFWDPRAGRCVATAVADAPADGSLKVSLPDVEESLMVKIGEAVGPGPAVTGDDASGRVGFTPAMVSGRAGFTPAMVSGRAGFIPAMVSGRAGFTPAIVSGRAGFIPAIAGVKPALRRVDSTETRGVSPEFGQADTASSGGSNDVAATEWNWRLDPLLDVVATQALAVCTYEAHIALPDSWRNRVPRVRDRADRIVPCHLVSLDSGAGWRLRIPATVGEPPFAIAAVAAEAGSPLLTDDPGPRGGLRFMSLPQDPGGLSRLRAASLARLFEDAPYTAGIRVRRVDQVENPLGSNMGFVARYVGPLVVPAAGARTFALNSDDGSVAFVDGTPAVQWLGRHDMDEQNRPMVNRWDHRGTVTLSPGVHWVACYHYNIEGAQLARLGWAAPQVADPALRAWLDASSGESGAIETVGDAYLDGRIPCRLVVLAGNRPVADVVPAASLRLRRPQGCVARAAVRDRATDAWTTLAASQPGRCWRRVDGLTVPVWVGVHFDRPFSMEVDQVATEGGGSALRAQLADLAASVTVTTPANRAGRTLALRAGEPGLWPLAAGDVGGKASVSVQGAELISRMVEPWAQVRADALRARPRPGRPERLGVMADLTLEGAGRAAAATALGLAGPEAAETVRVRTDPWARTCTALDADDARHVARGAVLIPLSDTPYALGLSRDELRERLLAAAQAVVDAKATPVFVLPATIDMHRPLVRQYALVLIAAAHELDIPLLDLREPAP